jgi:hypothetical protein
MIEILRQILLTQKLHVKRMQCLPLPARPVTRALEMRSIREHK